MPPPEPKTLVLMPHQAEEVAKLRVRKRHLTHFDMGLGKTIIVLYHCNEVQMPTVVLAPATTLHTAWKEDAKHFPGIDLRVARGSLEQRAKRIAKPLPNTVTVTTHESFRRDSLLYLKGGYKRMVVDEASKLRGTIGHANVTIMAAISVAEKCDRVILLTGKLCPNGTWEVFWPFRVMFPEVFGRSYWAFANRYFVPEEKIVEKYDRLTNRRVKEKHVIGFKLMDSNRAEYINKLSSHSTVLKKRDVLTLPPEIDIIHNIEMEKVTLSTYNEMQDSLTIAMNSGEQRAFKAAAALRKLQQLCGGVVKMDDEYVDVHRQKLEWLCDDFIEEVGYQTPILIWTEHRAVGDVVIAELGQRFGPECVASMRGGEGSKAGQTVADFQAGKIRYIVAHPGAAGHGTNGLQKVCSHAVYYELSFSADQHEQTRGRLSRTGMVDRSTIFTYPLLVRPGDDPEPSVDQTMLFVLRKKGRASEEILKAVKECGLLSSHPVQDMTDFQ